MSGKAADNQSGFALIESIAVLALSALVLLTMLIAADLVTRNSAAASRRANEIESLATGFNALRRDLAAAKHIVVGGSEGIILFQGSSTSLGMAVEGGGDGSSGDNLIWITTQEGDNGRLLVRSEAPLLPQTADIASAEFKDPAVLISGPWTYTFSYAQAVGPSFTWTSSWSASKELPAAIRVEVTHREGGRVLSPLVVPVHVDAGPARPAEL